MHNSKISLHLNVTDVKLLLEPDKDASLPPSYCLLLLINTDSKMITEAFANRIEMITFMKHHDQTGFIKGRHLYNYTCKLSSITQHAMQGKRETIIDSDAEKNSPQ